MKRLHTSVALRLLTLSLLVLGNSAIAETTSVMKVFRSPTCGCCELWVKHMRQAGFKVTVQNVDDTTEIRRRLGIPVRYGSCHTATIGGYTIEGHVPAADVKRLLAEKPKAVGLAVPGMPAGSPGMESARPVAYETLLIKADGSTQVFAQH